MKAVTVVCGLVGILLLLPASPRPVRGQTTGSMSDRLGSMSIGTLERLDVTRPAEQAQLMAARNAALLGEGNVDPDTYVLGPGDLLGLEILGSVALSAEAVVGADGSITLSQLGTFFVGGLTLTDARTLVIRQGEKLVRGGIPRLLLKSTRTFKVHVVGHVTYPGSYPASALTRVSEVVDQAHGFQRFADIRNIEVIHTDGKRDPADLLPFLLAGDLKGNPTLGDGDIVVVKVRTDIVEFEGPLLHPGNYNYVEGDELGKMLSLLKLHPRADRRRAVLQRYSDGVHWDTLSVDLKSVLDGVAKIPLQPGDRLMFRAVGNWHGGSAADVRGAVRYPGPVPIVRHGVTVREAIDMAGGFLEDATPSRVILSRPFLTDSTGVTEPAPRSRFVQGLTRQRYHEVVVDLSGGREGSTLDPGDIVFVPLREGWIEVQGQVGNPGFYDFHDGWGVKDYIEAAGGYASHADKGQAKLSRGRFGDIAFAKDVETPAPGDIIWVPERPHISIWVTLRDVIGVTAQAAALILVVREVAK